MLYLYEEDGDYSIVDTDDLVCEKATSEDLFLLEKSGFSVEYLDTFINNNQEFTWSTDSCIFYYNDRLIKVWINGSYYMLDIRSEQNSKRILVNGMKLGLPTISDFAVCWLICGYIKDNMLHIKLCSYDRLYNITLKAGGMCIVTSTDVSEGEQSVEKKQVGVAMSGANFKKKVLFGGG